jgi:S1-C subfamily serine protease
MAIYAPVHLHCSLGLLVLGATLSLSTPLAEAQELTEARRIAVAERLGRSTVTITVRGRGVGSGFVVGPERFIVTNAHVVGSARRRGAVAVHYPNGQVRPAQILLLDARHDLAILEGEGETPSPPIALGDSGRVRVGQSVLAYGSPHGLSGTLTQGIVSARRDNLRGVGDGRIEGLIQTDATINPGNSGGPLVDARGQVIGVNTLIISRTGGSDGIGFAVPSNIVRELVSALRQRRARLATGTPVAPDSAQTDEPAILAPELPVWLGIEGEEFAGFGMRGVRVQRVIPGGPAAVAGLRGAADPAPELVRQMNVPWTGYVILAMDGEAVEDWDDLLRLLGSHQPGDQATLTISVPPGQLRGDTVVHLAAPPRRLPRRLNP